MSETSQGPAASRRERGRVLVVDDEPGVRELFDRILRYRGYQVEAVTDMRAAFALLQAGNRYDAALIDLVMADSGGVGVLYEMRSLIPPGRTVVISGKLLSEGERQVLRELGVHYHAKPFRNDAVLATIECAMTGAAPLPPG